MGYFLNELLTNEELKNRNREEKRKRREDYLAGINSEFREDIPIQPMSPKLHYQLIRFGALTPTQMYSMNQGICGRSTLYRAIEPLKKSFWVYLWFFDKRNKRAYYATPRSRTRVLSEGSPLTAGAKEQELPHTLQCADILMALCTYENVRGLATPFEMSPDEINRFCSGRTPDGIVRVFQGDQSFEMAVEVETSKKTLPRVKHILDRYEETFQRRMQCERLLIVTETKTIHGMYTRALEKMPSEFQPKVQVIMPEDIFKLDEATFGKPTEAMKRSLELRRTVCQGRVQYFPLESTLALKYGHLKRAHLPTQVTSNQSNALRDRNKANHGAEGAAAIDEGTDFFEWA